MDVLSTRKSIGVFPGGGTQGIISAFLAEAFERESGKAFHENFDQIEGLSVGALNASCLWPLAKTGEAVLTTQELKDIYLHDIDDAFKKKFWSVGGLLDTKYNIEGLEKIIKRIFGDLKLSDFADGLHIYVIDVDEKEIRVLKSEDAKLNPHNDFYMRDLLRSAIAAPLFFEPVEIKSMAGDTVKFVDGGLFSSDPSFKAYFDTSQKLGPGGRIALTTFGTGHKNNEKISLDDLNGGVSKGGHMLNMLFKSKANTFHDMLKTGLGHNYVRMDVDLSNSNIGIVADHISQVIPYAEKAVTENGDKIKWALDNIRKLDEPVHGISISSEPPALLPDNVIAFPAYNLLLLEASAG